MNRGKRFLTDGFFLILLVALDQLTKGWAVAALKDQPAIPLIPGILELKYLENTGAAFGMLQGAKLFFVAIALIILAAIVFVLFRMPREKKYRLLNLLLVLIAAGAIGNLIDRFLHDYVVDFIYASFIDFPIFNVADIYVSVSAFFLVIALLFVYHEEDFAFLKKGRDGGVSAGEASSEAAEDSSEELLSVKAVETSAEADDYSSEGMPSVEAGETSVEAAEDNSEELLSVKAGEASAEAAEDSSEGMSSVEKGRETDGSGS